MELEGWLWLLLAVLALPFLVVERRRRRGRRTAMREVSESLGMTFTERGASVRRSFEWAWLFQQGSSLSRIVAWVMAGSEHEVLLLDYSYGWGQASYTTVAAFRLSGGSLPAFHMRPEGLMMKIRAKLGEQDIDFESHPDFSSRYLLQGADESAVRKLFNSDILQYFSQEHAWSVEALGEDLLIYRASSVSPAHLGQFLEQASGIAQLFESAAAELRIA